MTQPTTYLSIDDITALVNTLLGPNDDRRLAWLAAEDSEDQVGSAMQAATDLDALRYIGAKYDRAQPFAWPRIIGGCYVLPDPDATGDELVASLPRKFKWAYAIQCAFRARRRQGLDPTAEAEAAAHVGITSHSGGGKSVSHDLMRANSPQSRIDTEALAYLDELLLRSAEIV